MNHAHRIPTYEEEEAELLAMWLSPKAWIGASAVVLSALVTLVGIPVWLA